MIFLPISSNFNKSGKRVKKEISARATQDTKVKSDLILC